MHGLIIAGRSPSRANLPVRILATYSPCPFLTHHRKWNCHAGDGKSRESRTSPRERSRFLHAGWCVLPCSWVRRSGGTICTFHASVQVSLLLTLYAIIRPSFHFFSSITLDPRWHQSSVSSLNCCRLCPALQSYRVTSSQFTVNPASIMWITGSNSRLIYRITPTAISTPRSTIRAQSLQSPGAPTASMSSVWKKTT